MKKLFKNRKSVYFIGAILCCISSVFILFSLDKDKWKWIKGKVILPKKGARENEILRREAARRNRLKLELAACEKGDYKDEAHKWVWGWLKERVENYYRYSGRISIRWKV